MKYLALLALLQGAEAINLDHRAALSNQQKLYKVLENADTFSGYPASLSGHPGTENENNSYLQPYTRELPTVFQGDAANEGQVPLDQFTRNLIENYAVEGIDKDAEDAAKMP